MFRKLLNASLPDVQGLRGRAGPAVCRRRLCLAAPPAVQDFVFVVLVIVVDGIVLRAFADALHDARILGPFRQRRLQLGHADLVPPAVAEIEDIVEKYGFDVAGYDDGVDGDDDMFEVLLLKK